MLATRVEGVVAGGVKYGALEDIYFAAEPQLVSRSLWPLVMLAALTGQKWTDKMSIFASRSVDHAWSESLPIGRVSACMFASVCMGEEVMRSDIPANANLPRLSMQEGREIWMDKAGPPSGWSNGLGVHSLPHTRTD
ncbi:unnamed protein product [Protopolystoma xenopodis]|uniref:Uncharacterized protein n=1 Tax=Protopolystoma xenopodis TaxID=117903 RepID=A0A3S4ZXR3_9PLAT|nr:unnamed protein product [Protopolystoma xenopodis]